MKYKVVRTYPWDVTNPTTKLEKAFEEGWEYMTCNSITNHQQGIEILEYILCKEESKDESNND